MLIYNGCTSNFAIGKALNMNYTTVMPRRQGSPRME